MRADRQFHDSRRNVSIAEGNVRVVLGRDELQADRIEFDAAYRTLFARGSVRLRRGGQFFQASSFRYSLIQNEGQLDDVYGVIDLRESDSGFFQAVSAEPQAASEERQTNGSMVQESPAMACPPLLPPIPDWHPQPWALTAWGGQMIDSNFGDTFLFNGRMRPEYLLGVGLQKRILRAGPLSLELEADLFGHKAGQQPGGEFNQSTPFADLPAQSFGEGIVGIGARLWVQPWLSFGFIEGISYNTDYSLYEKTYRENYTQLLNYLGFEEEAAVSSDLSLVGRIHHRSGAFGTYSGVEEGSNAYLLGLRYRWGQEQADLQPGEMPPPLGCADPDRKDRVKPTTLSERLESVALGDGGSTVNHVPPAQPEPTSTLSPAEQQALRSEAIASIDQKVEKVSFRGNLAIERRSGVPVKRLNSSVKDENRFGVVKVPQLQRLGSTQLIKGTISRWRIQASRVQITAEGWQASRMGFSNDPFTPSQTRIDAEGVIAREQANGDLLISARRNRLIVEDRLPVPVSRRQVIAKEEEVENRWVIEVDNKDRDGLFVGRNLKPIELGSETEVALQPQFMVQRAIDGSSNGESIKAGDLFGLNGRVRGRYGRDELDVEADISTVQPGQFLDGSRFCGTF